MLFFANLRFVAYAIMAFGLLCVNSNKASAATAVIDSVGYSHGNPDSISLQVTFAWSSSGLAGSWQLWEDKSGDLVSYANNVGQGVGTGGGSYPHSSGTKQYSATARVYNTSTNATIVSADPIDTGEHSA